jgi:hypothetical protein
MKPQVFTLESEILEEFRIKMNAALETVTRLMIEKKLPDGAITAKIDIEMLEKTDKETGEIYYDVELQPNVNMKISAGGKIDCDKKMTMMKLGRDRQTYVASNQIDMFEMLDKQKGA